MLFICKNGLFTCHSAREGIRARNGDVDWWKLVWDSAFIFK